MFSYWEQSSFLNYDIIIIGAGIIGLSTAIELKQHQANKRILVLERGFMSSGASSRNAGFACIGSVGEILDDLKNMHEDEVINLVARRKKGLELLRSRLGDHNIQYQKNGSFELLGEEELPILDQIEYLNKLLKSIDNQRYFNIANPLIEQFGFNKNNCKGLIESLQEGEIHTGSMLRALQDLALEKGIEIKTNAEVIKIEEIANKCQVYIPDTIRNEHWKLQCQQLFICTNAFTKQFLPDIDLKPGRGQILLTKPIDNLAFKGIFHYDRGYYYFRALEGRVLFGGGRNLDFETETSTEISLNQAIQEHLEYLLQNVILPNTPFEIEQRWSGIMAFGATKAPIIKQLSTHIFGAFRMGGMGVALGSLCAQELVNLYLEKTASSNP